MHGACFSSDGFTPKELYDKSLNEIQINEVEIVEHVQEKPRRDEFLDVSERFIWSFSMYTSTVLR